MPISNSSTPTISSASPSRSGPGSAHEYAPCPPTKNGGSWGSVPNRPPPGAQCGKPTVQTRPFGPGHPPPGRGPHQQRLPSNQAAPRAHSRRQRTVQTAPVSTSLTILQDNRRPPQTGECSPPCRHLSNRPLLLSPAVRSQRTRQCVSPAPNRQRRRHNRSGRRPPHPGPNRRPVALAHHRLPLQGPYRHGAPATGSQHLKTNPTTIRPHPPSQRRQRPPRPGNTVTGRKHSGKALGNSPSRPHPTGIHRRCLNATATPTGATAHLMAPSRQAASNAEDRTRQPRGHRQEVRHLHPGASNVARRPNGQENHHRTGR